MVKGNFAFVTCIYDRLHGTPFGGRINRFSRYIESLVTISKTNADVFCFCAESDYSRIASELNKRAVCNVTLSVVELGSMPFYTRIAEIKASNPVEYTDVFWQHRCPEIMYGKFVFLEKIADLDLYDYLFWVDAGLAHVDCLSMSDYTVADEYDNLFKPEFVEWLIDEYRDSVALFRHTNPNNAPVPGKYNVKAYRESACVIGGLFGGRTARMAEVIEKFNEKLEMCLGLGELYSEEGILEGVNCDNAEIFNTTEFDTWYHRDWGDRYNPALKSFSDIFDKFKVKVGEV